MYKYVAFFCTLVLFLNPLGFAQSKRPMTPEDLCKIKRVSDPQVSPDGKWIAYTISVPDLEENSFNSDIWLIPATGGEPMQLTRSPESDYSPRWSPDGEKIAFVSERNGTDNLYIIRIDGGEAKEITSSEKDIYSPVWSKDGKYILYGSRILPEGKKDI